MKSIKVNSLPLSDVIMDIAKALNTDCTRNCSEYTMKLPVALGNGNIQGINFDGGLGIIQYDCQFLEDMEIRFIVNEIHPLKFLYVSQGTIFHRFGNEKGLHRIAQHQKAIVASRKKHGHVLKFTSGVRVMMSSLEISRRDFARKNACELDSMDPGLKKLFSDVDAKDTFYHDGYYSLQLADSILEMRMFSESDFVRKMFLEGQAYQLLTRQVVEYQDDLKEVGHRKVLRHSEIRLIEKAATILREELDKGHTVDSIAKRVGLNVNKLQVGFQHLYRRTVNEFVHQLRLEMAKEYLVNTDYSIGEIVAELGLSSASYFSKIFREHYDTSPSKFRSKYLEAMRRRNLKG